MENVLLPSTLKAYMPKKLTDLLSPGSSSTSFEADVAACGSLFASALDNLPDGVLVTSAARSVLFANRAFFQIWRIPSEVVQRGSDLELLDYVAQQLVDPLEFRKEVERLQPTSLSSHDEVLFKDGRIFSRRSVPFGENGDFQARIWIFTDVTEARNADFDDLTGLPNRRCYSRQYPAFAEAADIGLIKSVAIIDVDHFKAFNDAYGHAAGDDALRQIAQVMRVHVNNDGDNIYRIGGEEFLICLRTRNRRDAIRIFQDLRIGIAGLTITHVGNEPHGVVTISAGLGLFKGPSDPTDMFDLVDKALYAAKSGGRNRIQICDTRNRVGI